MDLSIIIPVWNEEQNVSLLYSSLKNTLDPIKKGYEIIFIDDGSTDNTFSELKKLNQKDKNVKIIQFQRHFGKAAGLSCGFHHAKGDIVFTMDGDLQDDPNEIPNFLEKIKELDLVVGWKYKRHDPISKTIPSKFFNWLTAKTTGVNIHDSNCGFKAFRKEVLEHLNIYGELHRYIPALVHWKGFKVGEVKVKHHPRKFGKSKYGIERLLKGFFDLVTIRYLMTYNKRPLHLFGLLGVICGLIGLIIGIYLTSLWFIGKGIGSRPLLMLAVLLIVLGIQFVSIGLLGEMITYSKEGESYTIKQILN